MTYAELIERASIAAHNLYPSVPLSRLRVTVEAEFAPTLREVAERFAGTAKGDQLRKDVLLTFSGGFATMPNNVLLKYLNRARFYTSDPNAFYSQEREGTDISLLDNRLGYWKMLGTVVQAQVPGTSSGLEGGAALDAICVPDTPVLADDPFTGPADMEPQLIDALKSIQAA